MQKIQQITEHNKPQSTTKNKIPENTKDNKTQNTKEKHNKSENTKYKTLQIVKPNIRQTPNTTNTKHGRT